MPPSSARVSSILAALAAGLILMPLASGHAERIEEKAQVCAACHGEAGIPQEKTTPVIWGQNEGYLYLQLRDFNKGARKNDLMSPIAADLSKDDMKALAAYFTQLAWPNLQQPSAAKDVSTKALTAIGSIGCTELPSRPVAGLTAPRRGLRPAERLPEANHARVSRRVARQQSRHVGSDEGDLAGGHRRDCRNTLAGLQIPGGATGNTAQLHVGGEARAQRSLVARSRAVFPLLSRRLRIGAAAKQQLDRRCGRARRRSSAPCGRGCPYRRCARRAR